MSPLPPPPIRIGDMDPVWQRWFRDLYLRIGGTNGRVVVISDDGTTVNGIDELEERLAAIPERPDVSALGMRLSELEGQLAGLALPNLSDVLSRLAVLEENMLLPTAYDGVGGIRTSQASPILAISFNYAINTRFVETTTANGGTATQSNSQAVLQTSTATNGSARLESVYAARYVAGTPMFASFAGTFTTGAADSLQELGYGDLDDGFFFAYSGATFGIIHRRGGSDTFVAQSAWNVDRLDGTGSSGLTIDPTKSNVYKIRFLWHGSGPIDFYAMPTGSSDWILVHRRPWAGSSTAPSLLNPSLPLWARAVNSGNATNLTMTVGSMAVYAEGYDAVGAWPQIAANGSIGNNKTGISSETSVITLRNKATDVLGGTNTNKTRVKILRVSFVSTSGATAFRLMVNSTLGGSPSYTSWNNTESVIEYDTAGTTITGGSERFRYFDPATATGQTPQSFDLSSLNIVLNPGDTLSATASGTTVSPTVSLQWQELF